MHLLAVQKKLKDEYKDPDVLPKINKSDIVGMMETIKEYLRSCHGVVRVLLAHVIKKTILVLTYGDYPKYVVPDNEMIIRMLHLPPDKNKIFLDSDVQSTFYDILDQIYTLTCIHMSNSISPQGMVKGHTMPSIPGGLAYIMSM